MGDAFDLYEAGILDEMGEYIGDDEATCRTRAPKKDRYTPTNTMNGVRNWLAANSHKVAVPKNKQWAEGPMVIVREYGATLELTKLKPILVHISKDFKAFTTWCLVNRSRKHR